MIIVEKTTYNDVYPVRKGYTLRKGRLAILIMLFIIIFGSLYIVDTLGSSNLFHATAYETTANNSLIDNINNVIETGSKVVNFIQDSDPELKSSNGLTSILLVGIDSRNVQLSNGQFVNTKPQGQAGTRNTDTILQIVFNHFENEFTMISIPRDMGVDVADDCLTFRGSIHWVYDKAQAKNCPGGGQRVLMDTVKKITGIEVHYYAFITLEAFEDIIRIVGETNDKGDVGIYLNNPKSFYELYPINDRGWESLYFPAGRQFMSPERALKFVRSRKFTSDFGRASRQQLLIEAIKERLLSMDIIFNPTKVFSLLDTLRNKIIFSEPSSLGEVKSALNMIKEAANKKIVHLVLDPDFGGHETYINKQPHGRPGPYYMVPTAWKECPGDEFCRVKEKIADIVANPQKYANQ